MCVPEVEMLSVLEACHSSRVGGLIVVIPGLPIRLYSVGTSGQPFTKMLMSSPSYGICAKDMKAF